LKSPKCNGILAEYGVQLNTTIKCIDNETTCSYETCMCDKIAAECMGAYVNKINDSFFNLPKNECRYESKELLRKISYFETIF
jgi:hypothetical protein